MMSILTMKCQSLSIAALIVLLQGCARSYSRDYQTMTLFHPVIGQEYWYTSKARFNAFYGKEIIELDRRIRSYLKKHPETSAAVVRSLMNYQLTRGMTRDEVRVLVDTAVSTRVDRKTGDEIWLIGGHVPFVQKALLIFDEDELIRIQSRALRTFPY